LRRRFQQFRDRHLGLTADSFHTLDDLVEHCPPFDAYVTGSDQVWKPDWLEQTHGRVLYLDFVSQGRRIAYAPSFGVSELPARYREQAAALVRRFDFLSAREDTGARTIRELTGREAEHVMDPTFLVEPGEYDRIAVAPAQDKPYILVYPMQTSEAMRTLALTVKKCLGLPLVAVVPVYHIGRSAAYAYADRVVLDAGPAEFLGWMKHASFVCTNAFHGAAFCVICRKNFLSVPHLTTNTRTQSLLQRLGLPGRQLAQPAELRPGDPALGAIDYAPVASRIAQGRKASLAFLERAFA